MRFLLDKNALSAHIGRKDALSAHAKSLPSGLKTGTHLGQKIKSGTSYAFTSTNWAGRPGTSNTKFAGSCRPFMQNWSDRNGFCGRIFARPWSIKPDFGPLEVSTAPFRLYLYPFILIERKILWIPGYTSIWCLIYRYLPVPWKHPAKKHSGH